MMALQILLLFKLILLFNTASILSYPNPIYGTKRYGRSSQHRVNTYDPYSYYQTPRYPVNYYKMDPYNQNYPDNYYYYYPQESYQYPMYYAPARTSKYEIYQAVLPYYYQETPLPRQSYNSYYDYADPVVDVQDQALQEAQREEREDNQPIGHESYYENDFDVARDDSNMEEVNAAFLQNLILSQMYQDSLDRTDKDDFVDYDEDFGRVNINVEDDVKKPSHMSEDETVRELKQLSEAGKENQYENKDTKNNEVYWNKANKQGNKGQRKNRQRQRKQDAKRADMQNDILSLSGGYDRKPIVKSTSSPVPAATSIEEPKREIRGQKEEFQMRPAVPVRRPFASPVMQIKSGEHERMRTPNVYDTIKHLLDMEKGFENNQAGTEIRPVMKKRIITPEESLTRQLSVLKKAQ